MPPTGLRQQCAVHAYASLLAEYGAAGKAYSMGADAASPPWTNLDPTTHEGGTDSTIATFISFFPHAVLATDLRGKQHRAADKIYSRGQDVKELINNGYSTEELHRECSRHAWNQYV